MKTSLEPQVNKLSHFQNNRRQSLCSDYKNGHTTANELKTQCVKINRIQKQTQKGFGHSQMVTNNFSRRNSVATIDSTGSSTNTLNSVLAAGTSTPVALTNSQVNNQRMHSLQSWSMSHLKNDCKVNSNVNKNKQINNYEFTEQRCNYERMTQQQQLLQQQQRSWSPEQVIRCNVSNSRIPTCSVDRNENLHKSKTTTFSDALNPEFLALNDFRMQNSKDCFSDRRHRLLLLRSPTSPTANDASETLPFECNTWFNDIDNSKSLKDNENISKSLASSFSSLSLATSTSMPYTARQRILREQLAKEFPHRKSMILSINKSAALSYQLKY